MALRVDADDVRPLGVMRHADSPSAGACSSRNPAGAELEPSTAGDSSAAFNEASAASHAGSDITGTASLLSPLWPQTLTFALRHQKLCVPVLSAHPHLSLVSANMCRADGC